MLVFQKILRSYVLNGWSLCTLFNTPKHTKDLSMIFMCLCLNNVCLAEILEIFGEPWHSYCIIFMIEYSSWGQNIKIKLKERPIQECNAKIMRLICTIYFRNFKNKTSMRFFLQMTGNLLGVKNQKISAQRFLVLRWYITRFYKKNWWYKYPKLMFRLKKYARNFNFTIILSTKGNQRLRPARWTSKKSSLANSTFHSFHLTLIFPCLPNPIWSKGPIQFFNNTCFYTCSMELDFL